jgi:O-glycosyl hydrolase
MRTLAIVLASGLLVTPAALAVERATYNSAGGLTSVICDGAELPIRGEFVVSFDGGVRQSLQPHDQKSPITRDGTALKWQGVSTFPNGGQAQFAAGWTESDAGLALDATVTSGGPGGSGAPAFRSPLLVQTVEYVVDLPRPLFVGGRVDPTGAALPAARPADPVIFNRSTGQLTFTDAANNWTVVLALDRDRPVTVTDRWTADGRSWRIRIRLTEGLWAAGDVQKFALTLQCRGHAHAAPARITVDPANRRYPFDGFGGNYCFNTMTPVVDYTMATLRQAWMRFELKAAYWDRQRQAPGPELRRDFELMQRAQRQGLPWIISLWRLPERYYADANQKPVGSFNRQIAADRWPEFLDLIGSYLLHVKQQYGAEPDYFSFNEPDLGVDIGFTPEGHRDMIKRIGAHLASLGLKTRMLLGDTANPRDTHKYVLPTAADPAAMKYVGAVSFHSWGSGTSAQYAAWGDVGQWIGLPLVVAEAGTDPGSYRNRTFDSYAYGLGEMRQFQELLRDSRPQALIYWEFTEDYGLVHVKPDGAIEPTGRYWLMKQLTNLTPPHSSVLASASDQPDVLVSAFGRDDALTVHILNTGPARDGVVTGLPRGPWRVVTTTETQGWQEASGGPGEDGRLSLPARSLTTLVRGG